MKKTNLKLLLLKKAVISRVTSAQVSGGLLPTTLIFTRNTNKVTKTDCK